jgi:hypothetical protein
VCNILGEATCGDTEGLCSQVFAWRFDEATGECTDREFIECIASGSSCQNAAGFLRDPGGQCWWSESTCGGLVKVRPDPSCGDGDPSMSGCGIR